MKKMILALAMTLTTVFSFAQTTEVKPTTRENAVSATSSGTTFVGVDASSIGFTNVDGVTNVNVGLTAGSFATQNLAVVVSTGYSTSLSDEVRTNDWYYGAGLKYYVASVLPIQVDWRGYSGNSFDTPASFVGVQGGYAWFPFRNFSIEPTVRYDVAVNDEYKNMLSGKVGFNLFF
jgi:hypothetical protein